MSLAIIVGIILIVVVVIIYNSIIGAKNSVLESFSAIDTVLQNRYDLIPNLIEVVKQYASHETGLITQIAEMRSKLLSYSGKADTERFDQENTLQFGMKSIFAIAENYPDLKASANFIELQTQWGGLEDRLQGARRAYNAAVKTLNDKKEMFPSSIVAGAMSLPAYTMFEADTKVRETKMEAKDLFNA